MAVESSDCRGNIDDQVCLFGPQVSTVQVPRTNIWTFCAPVSFINTEPGKNCGHVTYRKTGFIFTWFGTNDLPTKSTSNDWTCAAPGDTGHMKTPILSSWMLKQMKTWNLREKKKQFPGVWNGTFTPTTSKTNNYGNLSKGSWEVEKFLTIKHSNKRFFVNESF